MHKVCELEGKLHDIQALRESITHCASAYADRGLEHADTCELGQVVDMIKDLSEVEEKLWKAAYYRSVVEAMEDSDEEKREMVGEELRTGGLDRGAWGYNSRRYPSSGRYASAGHGMKYGYDHPEMMEDEYLTGGMVEQAKMSSMGYMMPPMTTYDQFREARRHYTETKSKADKDEMTSHAGRHIAEAEASLRDIWKDADPDLKRKMKQDLQQLVTEMQI